MNVMSRRCPHCRGPLIAHPFMLLRSNEPAELLVCERCDETAKWPVFRRAAQPHD